MYTVYIRSIILISSLKEVMPYEVWTRHKPDVFDLQIFSSLG